MENKHLVIRKIPLKIFINVLTNIWNNGADFIDISGNPDSVEDIVNIMVPEEYFSNEEEEEEENGQQQHIVETKRLDDDDDDMNEDYLNTLI